MKKQFLIYIFVFTTSIVSAQLFEAGAFLGGSNYIGDIGSTIYINPNRIAVGAVAKFNWTPRITFRGTAIYTRLHADDSKAESSFRRNRVPQLQFRNSIIEAAAGIEFSFFKYSLSKVGYTHTPYIIAQIGIVNYSVVSKNAEKKRVSSLVLPFGAGYKMKLARNIGIAFETSFRYTFKDVIDGNNHKIPGFDFGSANNDDWYVFTGVTIVYAFGRPGCYKGAF
jgi:uncharacterized protein YfiM (DUF2279 family)